MKTRWDRHVIQVIWSKSQASTKLFSHWQTYFFYLFLLFDDIDVSHTLKLFFDRYTFTEIISEIKLCSHLIRWEYVDGSYVFVMKAKRCK